MTRRAAIVGCVPPELVVWAALALQLLCAACKDGSEPEPNARAGSESPPSAAAVTRALGVPESSPSQQPAIAAPNAHAACQEEIARLRSELEAEREKRVKREQQWLAYTQGFQDLAQRAELNLPRFQTETGSSTPLTSDLSTVAAAVLAAPREPPPVAQPQTEKSAARAKEIFTKLRALLTIEEVHGFDLLEIGRLDADGFIGPVVLRVLDDRGRPLGSLAADRLRLECSRAAHTVTLVLEHGHERRQGVVTPFDVVLAGSMATRAIEPEAPSADGRAGVRRIVLAGVDPTHWISAVPELFRPADIEPPHDDGLYDLARLRRDLNRLLREDGTGSCLRIVDLEGVRHDVLRDVQIDVLDREGRIEKKIFADRLTCVREERGVQVLLEDGSTMRGDKQTPFLDGRMRVFLPRADAAAWQRAGVPFVAPVRESPTAPPSAQQPVETLKKASGGG